MLLLLDSLIHKKTSYFTSYLCASCAKKLPVVRHTSNDFYYSSVHAMFQ